MVGDVTRLGVTRANNVCCCCRPIFLPALDGKVRTWPFWLPAFREVIAWLVATIGLRG